MSKISGNKKYINLEGVRVSYRPKDDSIQITSTDEDLAGENFQLVLKKNTDAEQALRNILVDKGLIKEELREDKSSLLPTTAENPYLYGNVLPWNQIALGEKGENKPVIWDVSLEPHSLITGSTGSGKSVLQRTIFNHCLVHRWEFYGIDMTKLELSPYLVYAETTKKVATTILEGWLVLQEISTILHERYSMMADIGVNHYLNLPGEEPWRPIMLMLDEAFVFLSLSGGKSNEARKDDAMVGLSSDLLGDILRKGSAAGIHVTIATQRPDPAVIKGSMKANIDVRIVAGRMDSTPSYMALDSDAATKLPGGIKGRGIIRSSHELSEFQAYYTGQKFADEWVLLQQGAYEKERYDYLISQLGK